MSVIAIIGAGPGMGLAIARTFAAKGFDVALLARSQERLDELVRTLAGEGAPAAGYVADVGDHASVAEALAAVKRDLGPIDVLEFSPTDRSLAMAGPTEVTVENAQSQIEFYVHGAINAVQQVLPEMLQRGSGTVVVTTGASSVYPNAMFGNVSLAAAALRNWALSLHVATADRGVQVAHVAINAWIGNQPGAEADKIAPLYWDLHVDRDVAERVFTPEDGGAV
ncbi:MAG: SDR family NAD(P)-dependent oxidoreductase [Janthinobacterium lividum]